MLTCYFFFKLKKFFQEHYQSVKGFGSISGPTLHPDRVPNCLQTLSAKSPLARKELMRFSDADSNLIEKFLLVLKDIDNKTFL